MSDRHLKKFKEAVNDDLNTPKALAILWEVLKDESLTPQDKKKTVLEMDKVFGLGLATLKKESITIPSEVKSLVEQREKARREKNWGEADRLRSEIEKKGFEIKDTGVAKGSVVAAASVAGAVPVAGTAASCLLQAARIGNKAISVNA